MIRRRGRHTFVTSTVCLLSLALTACARFSGDGGITAVQDLAAERLGAEIVALRSEDDRDRAENKVRALLARPLTANAAVQIALLNNRDLQAAYNALGVAEARRVRESIPSNPKISFSNISGASGFEIERQVAVSVLSLATLPMRSEIAANKFRQAQLTALAETIRIATETRRAWIQGVTSRALVSYLVQAQETAHAASELSGRLGQSGAINKLDQARNQIFYAELTAQLAAARQRETAAREKLTRLMGLWKDGLNFSLPNALPSLPPKPLLGATVEAEAVRRRIDLQIARLDLEALAKSRGLTGATRFVSMLEVAGISKRTKEPGGEPFTQPGYSVDVQIPIFDLGETNMREAEEAYRQAFNRLVAKATNVRSEAREAYQAYRASYDIARHYEQEILPLRKIISDETLLRYNAMQIDVFTVLAEARSRIMSVSAAIEAKRNFYLAEAALSTAVIGGEAPPEAAAPETTVSSSE